MKRFVGEEHIIEDTGDLVYIGPDLPDEYTHSNYTMLLRGANAKAKANAAQGIPEMLLIANESDYFTVIAPEPSLRENHQFSY